MSVDRSETPDPPVEKRRRRALSHVGGKVELDAGDPRLSRLLERALDVDLGEERVLAGLHGFHSYPARMHPDTAAALIEGLSRPGDTVLDPFCGSGTILVQAQRLGRIAVGSDLNPIAIELASLKTARLGQNFGRALEAAALEVAEHATERQTAKLPPTFRYGPEDRELFAPHILLELDSLRDGIDALEDRGIARALMLVLSAILTKLSKKTGDSSEARAPKRLARGYAIRFFVHKTHDLAVRAAAAKKQMGGNARPARVEIADARELRHVRARSVSAIVTSPPYPGVYDYFEHHKLRLRWLRFDGRSLSNGEIGSRRAGRKGPGSIAAWERDFGDCLAEFRRVLRPGACAALLVADSALAGKPLWVDQWLPRLAARAGLDVAGRASQTRPHFHLASARAFGSKPRREHLVILEAR